MLKSIIATVGLSLIGVTAMAQDHNFNTIAQAEKYCPATTGLTFTSTRPSNPYATGTITGSHNGVAFISQKANAPVTNHSVVRPANLNASNQITDATFGKVGAGYGYIIGSSITCLYSYEGKANKVSTGLIMKGKQA